MKIKKENTKCRIVSDFLNVIYNVNQTLVKK